MSITVTTDVFCDWCSNWIEGTVAKCAHTQKSRAMAQESGWIFRWSVARQRYEDICPGCLDKLEEEETNDTNVEGSA